MRISVDRTSATPDPVVNSTVWPGLAKTPPQFCEYGLGNVNQSSIGFPDK